MRYLRLSCEIIAGCAMLFLAWAAFSFSLASVSFEQNPQVAVHEFGYGAYPYARQNDALYVQDPNNFNFTRVEGFARKSLAVEALNSPALSQMARGEWQAGRGAHAWQLMRLSEMVSRRHVPTQIWLGEYEDGQGHAAQSLAHLDNALRVSDVVRPNLYRLLSLKLGREDFQKAFGFYIQSWPQWMDGYMRYAAEEKPGISAVGKALVIGGGRNASADTLVAPLLTGLMQVKDFDTLRKLYLTFSNAHELDTSSPSFEGALLEKAYAPIAWALADSSNASASFELGSTNHMILHTKTFAPARTDVAHKLLYLEAGAYTLDANYRWLGEAQSGKLSWSLTCAREDKDVTIVSYLTSNRLSAHFSVSPQCGVMLLTLWLDGGNREQGLEFALDSPVLERVNSNREYDRQNHGR